jgi:hypothetical protein
LSKRREITSKYDVLRIKIQKVNSNNPCETSDPAEETSTKPKILGAMTNLSGAA